MKKLSNLPLVCVVWDDAHISLDEYSSTEVERDFHKPERVRTFGLLVKSDEVGATLAMEEGVTDGKFRHVTFVPKPMIVEIINLGPPRVKQKRIKKEAPAND